MAQSALYSTHVPLSLSQKTAVGLLSAVGALFNPSRADWVATVGEISGGPALEKMLQRMKNDADGRQILAARPRITNETVAGARSMGQGTFGHAYVEFMDSRGFEASQRPPTRFVDDDELAYVATRYREVHDLWHVLFRCPTTVSGELALKGVEFFQTGLPMTALAVLGGQYRLNEKNRNQLRYQLLPWALRAGHFSKDLMCIFYEKNFEVELATLRKKWGILPAPHT